MFEKQSLRRVLLEMGENPENILITTVGIHGNEQGALLSALTVANKIKSQEIQLKGRWIVLTGNLEAIKQNRRFIDKDLNRLWAKGDSIEQEVFSEIKELKELKEKILLYSQYAQNKYFADLHATSGEDGIFILVEQEMLPKIEQENFIAPLILADDNMLKNTLLRYMTDEGFISLAFEGGQIGSTQEIENHEFFIWKMLKFSGIIDELPVLASKNLSSFSKKLPRCLGFDYAHKITGQENFRMKLGFKNFSYVQSGEVLGWDLNGEVVAKKSGYLLMPLYQKTGYEGFFLISERNLYETHKF